MSDPLLFRTARLHGGRVLDAVRQIAFEVAHPQRAPDWGAALGPDASPLAEAMRRGGRFLGDQQSADGQWRGFLLYPGASTTWLTAHVAFVVEDIPDLERSCGRAANHLASVGPEDGGWGFNRRVGVDLDSSAQALMVLARHGREIPEFLEQTVVAAQAQDGGFPTYAPSGEGGTAATGWQTTHLDVSVLVAEWLRRTGRYPEALARCRSWIEDRVAQGGASSYWWEGPAYGLWALTRAALAPPTLSAVAAEALRRSHEPPELAMALAAALPLGVDRSLIVGKTKELLRRQLHDGSWPCARCLRVTAPTWAGPGKGAPGRLYADRRRIFSTAHSVAALQAVRQGLRARR